MRRLWLIFCQTVTVLLAALFVVATLKPSWLAFDHASPTFVQVREAPAVDSSTPSLNNSRTSFATAANKALPSVVHVFTSQDMRQRAPYADDPAFRRFFGDRSNKPAPRRTVGLGSGVIVSDNGYILTNNHVVEGADDIEIALYDGRKLPAKIVGRDPDSDLAVLHIAAQNLPAITFSKPESLHVGDVVLAIGDPFGVGQTVTMGIVSALGRSHLGINTYEDFIQTDAAINPGNSGGALVDTEGNLVGINAAIYSRSGGSLGIGFAIPVSITRSIMEQIIRTGSVTRGWIGVEVRDVTVEQAQALGLAQSGILITGIINGGPADKGGIQPGDLLVAINQQAVRDAQQMLQSIAELAPGHAAKLMVKRGSSSLDKSVKIGRRPPAVAIEE
ncbi:MAG: trypsin-like peptidase domain-containing protein [Betaproteobacteria bacterium]|nr:trypsin-like peptidase domain-containing protein [Betaproteobacteria bacterium]